MCEKVTDIHKPNYRVAGYILQVYMLAVIAAATQTSYNQNVLHIKLWAVIVAAILVLMGVIPRIKKHKFGFQVRDFSG
jgi:membrane protein YdbS with pleckstrin-like domain